MSEDKAELAWRETYFILLNDSQRPTLHQLEAAIIDANPRLKPENHEADDDGLFCSLFVDAPEDKAALEISYQSGDEVNEQAIELATSMKDRVTPDQLSQLVAANARIDLMHFERMSENGDEGFAADFDDEAGGDFDELDFTAEGLDPATLITVVEALANLTGGLPLDPAAGELLI